MKKLSKIVALLLASALTVLLFTACSGGGGGSFGHRDQDKEDEAFGKFTSEAQASSLKVNDKGLQAVADGYLQKDLNSSVEFFGAKLVGKVHVDGKDQEYLTITMTAQYDYGFIVTKILGEIQEEVGKELPGTKVDVNGNGSWTKLGVVVRSDGNHSYIAVAFQIKNPKK
ncbi:MAG: hypothetical protein MR946_09715 [Faecalibacterium sp.]|nr:hypothetical protein [Faecalibacterium sp.]